MAKRRNKERRTSNRPTLDAPKGKLFVIARTPSGRPKRYKDSAGREWTQYQLQKSKNGGLSPAIAARAPREVKEVARKYGLNLDYLASRAAFENKKSKNEIVKPKSEFWGKVKEFVRGYDLHSQRRRALKAKALAKGKKPKTPRHDIRWGKLSSGGAIQPELFGVSDDIVSGFDINIDDIESAGVPLDAVLAELDASLDYFGYGDWTDYDGSE